MGERHLPPASHSLGSALGLEWEAPDSPRSRLGPRPGWGYRGSGPSLRSAAGDTDSGPWKHP